MLAHLVFLHQRVLNRLGLLEAPEAVAFKLVETSRCSEQTVVHIIIDHLGEVACQSFLLISTRWLEDAAFIRLLQVLSSLHLSDVSLEMLFWFVGTALLSILLR